MKIIRELDVSPDSLKVAAIRSVLSKNIIGQEDAKAALLDVIQKIESNLFDPTKPIGNLLITGPTGVGKTRIVEVFCEAMYGKENNFVKIDCGEYQHSHEIAKLIGSPPGYLGHRETPAILNQDRIGALCKINAEYPIAVILFDEVEKASDALWHLMLGIMDKGTVTLGDNKTVDLTKTIILMTSNAGSAEMTYAINGGVGFQSPEAKVNDEQLKNIGSEAAKRKFSTEFINRLDKIVACNSLTEEQIGLVLEIEIERLQGIIFSRCNPPLAFIITDKAKAALIKDGFNAKYNARNVKRALERNVQIPLAKIIAAKELDKTEYVIVDYKDKFTFGVTK